MSSIAQLDIALLIRSGIYRFSLGRPSRGDQGTTLPNLSSRSQCYAIRHAQYEEMESRIGYEGTLGESADGLDFVVSIGLATPLDSRHLLLRTDPRSSLMVEFGCKQDAIIYCERMGS